MARALVATVAVEMDFGPEGEYHVVFATVGNEKRAARHVDAEADTIPQALRLLADEMERQGRKAYGR